MPICVTDAIDPTGTPITLDALFFFPATWCHIIKIFYNVSLCMKVRGNSNLHPVSFCSNYTRELSIEIHFLEVTVTADITTLGMSRTVTNFYGFIFLQSKAQTNPDSPFVLLDSMISTLHL